MPAAAARSEGLGDRLRRGIAAQAAGRHAEAESVYRAVLRDAPGLPDALHLLAQSRHLQGEHREALGLVEKAIAAAPRVAMYRTTRGIVLRALGDLAEAQTSFEFALGLDPAYLGAHRNLAALQAAGGAYEAARRTYTRALALAPNDAEMWLGLVPVLLALGCAGEAAAAAERAVRIAPRSSAAVEVWFGAAEAAGALPTLRLKLEKLVAEDPDNAPGRMALIDVLDRLEDSAGARAHAEEAVRRLPSHAGAWRRAGAQRASDGDAVAARVAFEQAVHLDPGDTAARVGLGNALHRLGEPHAALALYRAAISANPRFKEAWYNAGTVLSALCREDEAIAHFDLAIELDPDHAAARNNRAQGLLRLGQYAEAWADHRWREGRGRYFPETAWPVDLRGRRIHIRAEQGIGDHLFFLRFAPLVRARGAEVTVEAERRIEPMVQRAGLAAIDGPPSEAEVVRMGDLPWLLGLGDRDSIVPPLTLAPLADRRAKAIACLDAMPRPIVAVTWHAGGAKGRRETFKSIPIDRLGDVLRDMPGTVVSVQRNPAARDHAALEAALGRAVADLSGWNDDLEGMLALMAELDLYVGVSNANIHLRCGVGRGADILVPAPMDWRWRSTHDGAVPWYPGSRAHHQLADGDWSVGFASLRRALQEHRS